MITQFDLEYTNDRLLAVYAMGSFLPNVLNVRGYEELCYL